MKAPDTIWIDIADTSAKIEDGFQGAFRSFRVGYDTEVAYFRSDITLNIPREMATDIEELAKTVEAKKAEIARLTKCLAQANEGFERFERLSYLRLQELEKYGQHTPDCAKNKWMMHDFLQKQYGGANYSAGPELDCTCGLTAALKGEA